MNFYTFYDPLTGKILRGGACSEMATVWVQAQPGERVLPIQSNPDTQYIVGRMLTARPAVCSGADVSIIADGEDEYALTGLPGGTDLTFGAETFVIDDGQFIFSTALPGRWDVDINPPFPFQRQTFRVTANAP